MEPSDKNLSKVAGATDLSWPVTVRRSQSAADSIGRIAVKRPKPPLPPRRGVDYEFNGNIEQNGFDSRAVPLSIAAGSLVTPAPLRLSQRFEEGCRIKPSQQVTLAAIQSSTVATQKYFSLIRPTCFPLRTPGITPSHFASTSSIDNPQQAGGTVPTGTSLKQPMRPSRPAPAPPQKPPTPQPRRRLRCYSEPASDEHHAEDISRPASDNGAYASLVTTAPQRRLPDAQRSSPENVGLGSSSSSSSMAIEAVYNVPTNAIATAPVVLAATTVSDEDFVSCKLQGVTFRVVTFVAPPVSKAAEPKPDSLTACELPSVEWRTDELPRSNCDHDGVFFPASLKGNRSVEPMIPQTLAEEEEEETGDDYSTFNNCSVPLHPAPSRPSIFSDPLGKSSDVAADAPHDSSDYVDPVSITSVRAKHLSQAEVDEGANQQKDVVEKRRKKEAKMQRRDEKRQKEEEKQRRAQEKAEKKEKDRRDKDEQKRAAELHKLLSLYKVSMSDPPLCGATVKKDNLKPEKNELPVYAGERVFILSKDAKGRWLAKSSISRGSAIGIVAASNLLVAETETRGNDKNYSVDDPEGIYEELNK